MTVFRGVHAAQRYGIWRKVCPEMRGYLPSPLAASPVLEGRIAVTADALVNGARVDSTTARRASEGNIDLDSAIARHASYPALRQLGDLVVTGSTGTNISGLWTIVIGPPRHMGRVEGPL